MNAVNDICRAVYGEAVERQFGCTYDELADAIARVREDQADA